jgi:hypothetical protein
MNWLKKLFGTHIHERELFLVGRIAFVKCVTCGDESIPWEVSQEKADACTHRKYDVKRLVEINNRLGIR